MATDKKFHPDGPSAVDRALERFTELMIEKIQSFQGSWKKPWFIPGAGLPPRNLFGRHYSGGNSLMLMLQAEKMGYDIPVWGTFDSIMKFNQVRDESGNKLPQVSINKGEKSFPVFLTTYTVVNPTTKERINYEDYRNLPKEEQSKYKVFPKTKVFNVFNVVGQTNIAETRPQLYEKLQSVKSGLAEPRGDLKSAPAIDKMIDDDLFYCPINKVRGDNAYYSPSRDVIVVPVREQFVDGEAFATNTLHECAHATGARCRLGRIQPGQTFGSQEYAKEELTAELSAALVASRYGLTKHVKSDSAAYLKSWLDSLRQGPEFLKTLLADVKGCSGMIIQRIEAIQEEMEKGEKADYSKFKVAGSGMHGEVASQLAAK